MKKYKFLLVILLASISLSQAQYIRCGTYELHKQRMENDPQYRAYYENIGQKMQIWQNKSAQERTTGATTTIVIPVVVHILWYTDDQDISDAQVHSQIDVLNEDYSGSNPNRNQVPGGFQSRYGNVNLNFCLATRTPSGDYSTGIERRQVNDSSLEYEDATIKSYSLGGLDAWDRTKYLNIWVCNMSGGLLGYTEMPGGPPQTDGCVILYSAFGRGVGSLLSHYNLGRTATHEIGHWLGLFHVWGDDGGECSGTDYIYDTPNQADATYGCPAFPKIDPCSSDTSSSNLGDPVNGIMFMNYLDYSDDDCMSMFTVDQVAVMRGVLNDDSSGRGRFSIQSSDGCTPPTGIAEINASTFIDLYPNPASQTIHISIHLPTINVSNVATVDLLGKQLLNSEVNKTGEQSINLDVSSLSAGLYTLIVKTDQGNISKRFAITR